MIVAGMDGCRVGWVLVRVEDGAVQCTVEPTFRAALAAAAGARVVGVDMPIGLARRAQAGGRACDLEARVLLGPRASSVFSPPARSTLGAVQFRDALEANRRTSPARIGLTQQSFHLFPKLREVDAAMTAGRQRRVREVHPELAFATMAGAPLRHSKRTPRGLRERRALLRAAGFGRSLRQRPPGADWDDVLDAHAVAWTAARIALGAALRLPARPERDARGLRMEVWA